MLQIIGGIVRVLLVILVAGGTVMGFVSFGAVVIGLIRTAQRRKPGVRLLVAITSLNVIFAPQLYTDDARRWARLHILGFVGVFVSVIVTGASIFGLKAFDQHEGDQLPSTKTIDPSRTTP